MPSDQLYATVCKFRIQSVRLVGVVADEARLTSALIDSAIDNRPKAMALRPACPTLAA